jgi:hypothetical protein
VLAECQLANGMKDEGMKTMDKALARPDAVNRHPSGRALPADVGNKDWRSDHQNARKPF